MEKTIDDLKSEVETLLQEYVVVEKRRKVIRIIRLCFVILVIPFYVYGAYMAFTTYQGTTGFNIRYLLVAIVATLIFFVFMVFGIGFFKLEDRLFLIGDLSLSTLNIIFYIALAIFLAMSFIYETQVSKLDKIKNSVATIRKAIEVRESLIQQFTEEMTKAQTKTARSLFSSNEPDENAEKHEFY